MTKANLKSAKYFIEKSIEAWSNPNNQAMRDRENITIDECAAAKDLVESMNTLKSCNSLKQTVAGKVSNLINRAIEANDQETKTELYEQKMELERILAILKY